MLKLCEYFNSGIDYTADKLVSANHCDNLFFNSANFIKLTPQRSYQFFFLSFPKFTFEPVFLMQPRLPWAWYVAKYGLKLLIFLPPFPKWIQVCAITPNLYTPGGLDPTLLTSQVHHLGYTSSLPFLFFHAWIWWVHLPPWWVAFIPQFSRYKLPEPWALHLPKSNHSNYRLF